MQAKRFVLGGLALCTLLLTSLAPAQVYPLTRRVSQKPDGTGGDNYSSYSSISADGRYVAFSSFATNLVSGDVNGTGDVFVLDRDTGEITRVSVSSAGVGGNGSSGGGSDAGPSISADGRYVAFLSYASNLVPNDNNGRPDIFVHDRLAQTTRRVSVSSDGVEGNSGSSDPVLSADGRFVAFTSAASNFTGDFSDNNASQDVFVHDLLTGQTSRVSVRSDGAPASGVSPAISADGRYVAFLCWESLVPEDQNNNSDIYVRDRLLGTTTLASKGINGFAAVGAGAEYGIAISADGRYVAFNSSATNVVANDDNNYMDTFVVDRLTGVNERVNVNEAGLAIHCSYYVYSALAISPDGRYVSFTTDAPLLTGDTNGLDLYVRDRLQGVTRLASVDVNGERPWGYSSYDGTSMSADGRYVTFRSDGTNHVASDINGKEDVFLRDFGPRSSRVTVTTVKTTALETNTDFLVFEFRRSETNSLPLTVNYALYGTASNGVDYVQTTNAIVIPANEDRVQLTLYPLSDSLVEPDETINVILSAAPTNQPYYFGQPYVATATILGEPLVEAVGKTNNGPWANHYCEFPSLSADGRYVVFRANASNLVPNDSNGRVDVFVRDRQTQVITRVSVASDGTQANNASGSTTSRGGMAISGDGRYVAFQSSASNLDTNDVNGQTDIFLHDLLTHTTRLISRGLDGAQASSGSTFPALSGDGRYVGFLSYATNLVATDTNGTQDFFLYDQETDTIILVGLNGDGSQLSQFIDSPALSADGRHVAFSTSAANLGYADANNTKDVFVRDRQTGAVELVSRTPAGQAGSSLSDYVSLSANGRYVAFCSYATNLVANDTNGAPDVFVYDRQAQALERVSVAADGRQQAVFPMGSYWTHPSLSGDGRYVAYTSRAVELVPGDANGSRDIFIYDRQTQAVRRASVTAAGTEASNWSDNASLSASGQFVAFQSMAPDMVAGDTNHMDEVFVAKLLQEVAPSFTIAAQPSSRTTLAGGTVVFTVTVPGSWLSYQWQKDGVNLLDGGKVSGAQTATLTLTAVGDSQAGVYTVVVSDGASSVVSSGAALTVVAPPSILTQPAGSTRAPGQSVVLSVEAEGQAPLLYQWRKNGNALSDGSNVSGVSTPDLTLANLAAADGGNYTVIVSNTVGSVTSQVAVLTVQTLPPGIAVQPRSQTNLAGATVFFTITATGTEPLSYQWKRGAVALTNGGAISGAQTAALTLSPLATNQAGVYSVTVSSPYGSSVTSGNAILNVWTFPTITKQPVSVSAKLGAACSFSVTVSGTSPMTNQWFKNGLPLANGNGISGVTLTQLNLTGLKATNAGSYQVVVRNVAGSVTSAPAVLTIVAPPTIAIQPGSRTNNVGSAVIFQVHANGSGLVYQWRKGTATLVNGGRVSGAQTTALTLSNLQLADAGAYSVLITNGAGRVVSAPANLTVLMPPVITTQPQTRRVPAGSNAVFEVVATGSAPLKYQWRRNGTNLLNGPKFAGATTARLTVLAAGTNEAALYSATVGTPITTVTSSNASLILIPRVQIKLPLPTALLTNPAVTISGTAYDAGRVTNVEYSLNGAPWTAATGFTNWTAPVTLAAGTNLFAVRAQNARGEVSDVVIQRYFLQVPSRLTVTVQGLGTVTPNLNGQLLSVGRNYELLAVPGAKQVFANWTGSVTSETRRLVFRMTPGMQLKAAFVPSPFVARKGIFNGLFYETDEVRFASSGYIQMTLNEDGTASGSLWLGGKKVGFSQLFPARGALEFVVYTNSLAYTVNLDLDMTAGVTNVLTGRVRADGWEAPLLADRSGNGNGAGPAAALAGNYTWALTNESNGASSPGGDGVGILTVAPDWTVKVNGRLADDTVVTPVLSLARSGHWPFYVSLYNGRGAALGWMTFTNHDGVQVEGAVSWIKGSGAGGARYGGGFSNEVYLVGSKYAPAAAGKRVLAVTNGMVALTGSYLGAAMTNNVTLNANNTVTVTSGPTNKLALTIQAGAGTVTGTFQKPGSAVKQTVNGVVLQGLKQVRGYHLSTNASGALLLKGR